MFLLTGCSDCETYQIHTFKKEHILYSHTVREMDELQLNTYFLMLILSYC